MKIEKIQTDNPLIDEIIYNCMIMINGCILKDEDESLQYETLDSIKQSDIYMAISENRQTFDMFNYTVEMMQKALIPDYLINDCIIDNNNIPIASRPVLVKIASDEFMNNYIELNNYYRRLNGQPDLGDVGLLIDPSIIPDAIKGSIDTSKYIHELSDSELELLESYGVIDILVSNNPSKKYLKYLTRKVPIYTSRKADKFDCVYLPQPPSNVIYDNFKTKLNVVKSYTMKVVYSEAYKFNSKYYDKFIMIFILLQTMSSMIIESPEYIIRRDVFDIKTIQYIFESNGVEFFQEIPIKYQIRMIRNLNKLIKFKSTTANIIDICSLFGFDSVEVFKYYLLKDRVLMSDGKYANFTKEVADPADPDKTISVEDVDKNYELKFIKVPINELLDNNIQDKMNILSYDDVTSSDPYWDGNKDHQVVKSMIINKEFNYERSKYLSIDTVYEATELSFEMPYFFNMLFDDTIPKDQLLVYIPYLNDTYSLVDVFIYLYSLMYEYYGIQDDIMDTTGKVLHVKGFNFKANLSALAEYVKEQGYTLEELGCADFQIPSNGLLTYNQLLQVFTKNKNIYNHIVKELTTCDNKKIYDIYKKIYDSLMITELNMHYFQLPDGTMAKTYTDFLQSKNRLLYNNIMEIKSIQNEETKKLKISETISNVIYSLEEYISTKDFQYIYSNLPSVSIEFIEQYVYKVINFFKSYRISLIDIKTMYKFDDKLENRIEIIDSAIINYIFSKSEIINMIEKLNTESTISHDEVMNVIEKIYMDITYWTEKLLSSNIEIKEDITQMIADLFKIDELNIKDSKTHMATHTETDTIIPLETSYKTITETLSENVLIPDKIMNFISSISPKDNITLEEFKEYICSLGYIDNTNINDDKSFIVNSLMQTEVSVNEIISDIIRWYSRLFSDRVILSDDYITTTIYNPKDVYNIRESISSRTYNLQKCINIITRDIFKYNMANVTYKDALDIVEKIYIDINYMIEKTLKDSAGITDQIDINVFKLSSDNVNINDSAVITVV